MRLRISSLVERLRASLFFIPMIGVLIAVAGGLATVELDDRVDGDAADLPLGLASTVESARAVLSTVAGATIAFAGVAFSITLLVIQLASSQYSPRVVTTVFRDPFNRRVMALVVGTFTYCVMVLRSVRSPLDAGGEAVIPNISVGIAVVAGITTILAVVAFINHNAHAMDISEILEHVRRDAVTHVRHSWPEAGTSEPTREPPPLPDDGGTRVRFDRSGWVQEIDHVTLAACIPAGRSLHLDTAAGRYAIDGTVLCATDADLDGDGIDARRIRAAVAIGTTRTMQQDVSYGLRQLADVALRALSPGINDPTTAQDAIFHAAAVLAELLHRDAPPAVRQGPEGGWLVLAQQHTHEELLGVAFDEVRRAAAAHPAVCVYLLEALHLLDESLVAAGLEDRSAALVAQADLVLAGSDAAELVPADREMVREAHSRRFGGHPRRPAPSA